MTDEKLYLVPDYFPNFHCKIGSCRHACCDGWPVSITIADYFHLIGVACSQELRKRLDIALHVVSNPTEEKYAQITPRYDGTCALHMEDGRCALQAELGEEILPDVCRLYPRGVRYREESECSCANSCEAVPELFLHHPAPIQYIKIPYNPRLSGMQHRQHIFETAGREEEIRLWLIQIMQNRDFSLPNRLSNLGQALTELESALDRKDFQAIDKIFEMEFSKTSGKEIIPGTAGESAFSVMESILKILDERSDAVRDYGEYLLNLPKDGDIVTLYQRSCARFETLLPDWQIVFEHLLVNHMFFEQFPFQDRPVPIHEEYLAICAVYGLLRVLSVTWTAEHSSQTDFVDVCAAVFRLIEHTAFDIHIIRLLKELDFTRPDQLRQLLAL